MLSQANLSKSSRHLSCPFYSTTLLAQEPNEEPVKTPHHPERPTAVTQHSLPVSHPCVLSAAQPGSHWAHVLKTPPICFWKSTQSLKHQGFTQAPCTPAQSSVLISSLYSRAVRARESNCSVCLHQTKEMNMQTSWSPSRGISPSILFSTSMSNPMTAAWFCGTEKNCCLSAESWRTSAT